MGYMKNDTRHGWTTPEESRRLSEAGLNKGTADLWYLDSTEQATGASELSSAQPLLLSFVEKFLPGYDTVPCWTIGRLLSIMPNSIERNGNRYSLCADGFGCGYFRVNNEGDGIDHKNPAVYYMNEVSFRGTHAVAETALWLLEKGYKLYPDR